MIVGFVTHDGAFGKHISQKTARVALDSTDFYAEAMCHPVHIASAELQYRNSKNGPDELIGAVDDSYLFKP